MKLEADVKNCWLTFRLPDRVSSVTDASSVLPPARIWTVSKVHFVSNLVNCKTIDVSYRSFQRPLAVGQRPVLARLVWAFV